MSGEILIAYDGSQDAREATIQAGKLFNGRRAVVANVWQSLAAVILRTSSDAIPATMSDVAAEIDAADIEGSKRTAEEGRQVAREAGLAASRRCVEGETSAWRALLELADEIEAAAVVVGSRGLSGVKSLLLGSVSAGVLHHASRPVLVAPPPDRASRKAEGPVLIGYDGSDYAQNAIRAAAALLPSRKARIVTVWTSARHAASASMLGAPAGVVASGLETLAAKVANEAVDTAGEGARLANEAGMAASFTAAEARGNVWAMLVQLAIEQRSAAVVVGSQGRSGAVEALLGSVKSYGGARTVTARVAMTSARGTRSSPGRRTPNSSSVAPQRRYRALSRATTAATAPPTRTDRTPRHRSPLMQCAPLGLCMKRGREGGRKAAALDELSRRRVAHRGPAPSVARATRPAGRD